MCIHEMCGEAKVEQLCHRMYRAGGAFLLQWCSLFTVGKSSIVIELLASRPHFFFPVVINIINLNSSFNSQKHHSLDNNLYENKDSISSIPCPWF